MHLMLERSQPQAAQPAAPPGGAETAWRLLDEIDYGMLLVSAEGELQHANQAARHELSRGRFLRASGSRLTGSGLQQTAELRSGIQRALGGHRQLFMLRQGADTLPVTCVPLRQRFDEDCASVLLMLGRQPGAANLNLAFFARTHRLTPAEQSVLKALCDGLRVQEIARAHGVSECTIRTQVRSLREKTGAGSMRLLVQHVSCLPPLVPMNVATPGRPASGGP